MLPLRALLQGNFQLRKGKINPANPVQIKRTAAVPNGNYFAVQGNFRQLTDPRRSSYDTVVAFYDIRFKTEQDATHKNAIEVFENEWYYFNSPSFSQSPARCVCTCADFYFTWWYFVARTNSMWGVDFPAYQRKTPDPPLGYPYRNPREIPGLCKHIFYLCDYLARKGIITP